MTLQQQIRQEIAGSLQRVREEMHTAIRGRLDAISSISSDTQRLSAGPAETAKPYRISDLIPKMGERGKLRDGSFTRWVSDFVGCPRIFKDECMFHGAMTMAKELNGAIELRTCFRVEMPQHSAPTRCFRTHILVVPLLAHFAAPCCDTGSTPRDVHLPRSATRTHVSYRFHFPPPFALCPSVSVCVTLPGTVCVSVSVCLSISVSLFLLFLFLQHEGRTENGQAQTEMLLTEKWQECCATSQSMTNRSRETRLQNAQCANQTVGTADDLGSLIISFCCNWCTHVQKHYFTWFYVEEGTAGKKAKQMTGMCGVRTVTQRQQLRS